MTPLPIAPLLRRLTRWRIARLSDRIGRIERWMDGMPISSEGPSYGELAVQVQRLRQELDRLRSSDLPRRSPGRFQPSVKTATF